MDLCPLFFFCMQSIQRKNTSVLPSQQRLLKLRFMQKLGCHPMSPKAPLTVHKPVRPHSWQPHCGNQFCSFCLLSSLVRNSLPCWMYDRQSSSPSRILRHTRTCRGAGVHSAGLQRCRSLCVANTIFRPKYEYEYLQIRI